jgi:hypothetical protein
VQHAFRPVSIRFRGTFRQVRHLRKQLASMTKLGYSVICVA